MPRDDAALALDFADLFDHLGTDNLCYSAKAQTLSGREVAVEGFLAHAHGPEQSLLLVDQPGICPDCSPAPAAVITLFDILSPAPRDGARPVRVLGRLDFGFRIDAGVASFLRIENAAIVPVEVNT